jgi:protein SCO1/2
LVFVTGRRVLPRAVALAALLAALGGCGGEPPTAEPAATPSTAVRFAGEPLPAGPAVHGFSLTDQDGQTVRLADERGRVVVVTFLYASCPDVCPLIAPKLNAALAGVGHGRSSVRVLAVSVDPEGDTPDVVRAFADRLRLAPEFRYLTGSRAELAPVWQEFNIVVEPRGPERVGHGNVVVLLDREGRARVVYDDSFSTDDVVHDVLALLRA